MSRKSECSIGANKGVPSTSSTEVMSHDGCCTDFRHCQQDSRLSYLTRIW